jgi:pimeloyl-ACP methyl ester carboxylesterase
VTELSLDRYKELAQYSLICGHKIAHWQSYDAATNDKQQTIVFIHGFPSASWDWHYQWKYLARDYSLLCADMLGFGLSAKPREHRYSLLEQADILEALLLEKGVGDYHIMAHDYGDSVAQELLYRQATRRLENSAQPTAVLKSVCFLNGGIFPACHRPIVTQRLLKSWLGKWMVKWLTKRSLEKSFYKIFGKDTPPMQQEIDMTWQLLQHNEGYLVVLKYCVISTSAVSGANAG